VCSAFVGPLGGGYLQDTLGFEMSAVVIGSCSMGAVSFFLIVDTNRVSREGKAIGSVRLSVRPLMVSILIF